MGMHTERMADLMTRVSFCPTQLYSGGYTYCWTTVQVLRSCVFLLLFVCRQHCGKREMAMVTKRAEKIKRGPDASDPLKYAPQRHTAIHIYTILQTLRKSKNYLFIINFLSAVILALLSVWIIWLYTLIGIAFRSFSAHSTKEEMRRFLSFLGIWSNESRYTTSTK